MVQMGAFLHGPLWVLILSEYWSARLELVPAFRLLALRLLLAFALQDYQDG